MRPRLAISIGLLSPIVIAISVQKARGEIVEDCSVRDCAIVLEKLRSIFPETIAQMEDDCPNTNLSSLSFQVYQNENKTPRASFVCWERSDPSTHERAGNGLGTLPISAIDSSFIKPLSCHSEDTTCNEFLPLVRSNYPQDLQRAELQCAMRNGELFFSVEGTQVDLRCGFMAGYVWDENGDGDIDYEDQISVDISVGKWVFGDR